MKHFLDFDEWMGAEDREWQFDFDVDEPDVEFDRWCELKYDEYLGEQLDLCASKINQRAGGAS